MANLLKILHLEDEEAIVTIVQRMLEKEGLKVNITNVLTEQDFLKAIENKEFDLVIADYVLPEFDGLTALRLLRERNTTLPFILFSGSIGEAKAIASLRNGATDYVLKQNIQALAPAVKRALNEANLKKEQRLAEGALRNSEELYRTTIQNIPLAILTLDTGGVIVMVNNSYTKMFGSSTESVINKLKINSFQPFVNAGISPYFSELIKKNNSFDFESPLIFTESGKQLYLRCRGIPCKDLNGNTTSYLILLGDITERKRAEQTKKVMLRIASAASNIVDDKQFYAMLKDELNPLLDTSNFFVGLYEADSDSISFPFMEDEKDRFQKIAAANTISSYVIKDQRSLLLSGDEVDTFIQDKGMKRVGSPAQCWLGVPLIANDEAIGLMVVQSYDDPNAFNESDKKLLEFAASQIAASIKRKLAENRLNRLNRQNEILISSFTAVLMVMDKDERIIRWNVKAQEVFGQDWPAVREKQLLDVPLTWDWTRVTEGISISRESRKVVELPDVTFKRSNGGNGFLNISISPFVGEQESIEGYLIHAEDVTEKKIADGQQAHTQKLESIGQLAAGIAHEINTPAQYVGDNTHFLKDSFNDLKKLLEVFGKMQAGQQSGSELQKLLTEATKISEEIDLDFLIDEIPVAIEQSLDGITKVSKIVRAMKEFSHPGSKDKTLVDLNRAIENTVTVSRNEWKYVADVSTEFDESLSAVPCFPDEFNQVILNIIINAAHAIGDTTKEGDAKGLIQIQTETKEKMAEIRISDNGTGMPEEIRKKIFDPFFTTKEVGKGTGQGLAISHDVIVNKHGGVIEVESEPGKGTTFIIRLPLED